MNLTMSFIFFILRVNCDAIRAINTCKCSRATGTNRSYLFICA